MDSVDSDTQTQSQTKIPTIVLPVSLLMELNFFHNHQENTDAIKGHYVFLITEQLAPIGSFRLYIMKQQPPKEMKQPPTLTTLTENGTFQQIGTIHQTRGQSNLTLINLMRLLLTNNIDVLKQNVNVSIEQDFQHIQDAFKFPITPNDETIMNPSKSMSEVNKHLDFDHTPEDLLNKIKSNQHYRDLSRHRRNEFDAELSSDQWYEYRNRGGGDCFFLVIAQALKCSKESELQNSLKTTLGIRSVDQPINTLQTKVRTFISNNVNKTTFNTYKENYNSNPSNTEFKFMEGVETLEEFKKKIIDCSLFEGNETVIEILRNHRIYPLILKENADYNKKPEENLIKCNKQPLDYYNNQNMVYILIKYIYMGSTGHYTLISYRPSTEDDKKTIFRYHTLPKVLQYIIGQECVSSS